MADIFLSYAKVDRERVQRIYDALKSRNLEVFWDHDILGGEK